MPPPQKIRPYDSYVRGLLRYNDGFHNPLIRPAISRGPGGIVGVGYLDFVASMVLLPIPLLPQRYTTYGNYTNLPINILGTGR